MAFQKKYGNKSNKGKAGSIRLTGLFDTSKPMLCVGSIDGEQMAALGKLLLDAKKKGRPVVLFLYNNGKNESPHYGLSAAIGDEATKSKNKRRRDEEEEEQEEDDEEDVPGDEEQEDEEDEDSVWD